MFPPPRSPVESFNVVYHSTTPDRLQTAKNHETVENTDDDRFNNDWWYQSKIANQLVEHRLEVRKFDERFANMWDTHLARITTAEQQI